jgi:flagellar biosynthesis protein FlhB
VAQEDELGGDRTEAATQRHLDQAREEGQVPVSREVATFASLATAILVLGYQSQALLQHLLPNLVIFLSRAGEATMRDPGPLRLASSGVLSAVVPVLCAASFAGAVAVLLQTKFLLNLKALQPKFSRISPAAGIKRMFGSHGIVEFVKSLSKLALLATAIWIAIKGDWPQLMRLPWQDPHGFAASDCSPGVSRLHRGCV